MAISVMTWVWEHSRSRHGARLVLLALADYLDEDRPDGTAWPSVAALAKKTALKERAVRAAIADLRALGELAVEENAGPSGVNRYRVITKTPAKNAGVQKMQGAESAPPQDSRADTSTQASGQDPADFAGGADSAGVQNQQAPPAKSAPGTTNEPPENSPTESSRGSAEGAASSTLFGEGVPQPTAKTQRSRRAKPKPDLLVGFDKWYAAYPVHKARGDAEKAYAEQIAVGVGPDILLDGAIRYQQDRNVRRGWGKYPATWLRAKCWLDEDTPGTQGDLATTNGHGPGGESTGTQRARAGYEAGQRVQAMIDRGEGPA